MKHFLPILIILLCACSGAPAKKEAHEPAEHHDFDSVLARVMKFKNAREEKMADIPYDPALSPTAMLRDDFRFVIKGKYIVLQLDVDTLAVTGDPELTDMDLGFSTVAKSLVAAKVPDSLKKFVGRKFHMINTDGLSFDASIKSLRYMVAYYPPYGEYDNGERDTVPSLKLARQVWADGADDHGMIVGEIDSAVAVERNIIAAVPAENPVPVFFEASENKKISGQAENDIRLTTQFDLIQKNFLTTDTSGNPSVSWLDDAEKMFFYTEDSAKNAFYTQTITSGDYCGAPFYAELSSAWQMTQGQKQKLLFIYPGYCYTQMIFDQEGDGTPEFYAFDSSGFPLLYKKVSGKWQCVAYMYLTDMRCPC